MEWYTQYFNAVTGKSHTPADLITMSEKVYNFQRILCLKLGYGRREHDAIPYRSMGPVTIDEYESRAERYDKQLKEIHGINIEGMGTPDKVETLRKLREQKYEQLKDAVYERRGWTNDGIPTLDTVRRLGIDFPEIVEVLKAHGVT